MITNAVRYATVAPAAIVTETSRGMTPTERQRAVVRSLRREADSLDAAGRHAEAEQARRTAEAVRVIA